MIPLSHYLVVSAILFAIGSAGVFLRKNLITILLSVEIMLNAVNLSFVAFGRSNGTVDGQIITFFVMTVAAAEAAVGLSSKHTLAIVTREGATAADVIRFASGVAQRVEACFGVRLRPEPVLLGFAGSDVEPDVEYLLGAPSPPEP